ncbi:hypothetical protein QR685DRAFT_559999 [Neurospora intermedia]|uniref:Uncharacterized protein n=1 Tax=Neurospora intermedia TaxID=5142 RepID=A0ABR3DU79_NEUIN
MAPFRSNIVATLRKANEELIESLQAQLHVAERFIEAIANTSETLTSPAEKKAARPLRE